MIRPTLNEVKQCLRIDSDDEDSYLNNTIFAADSLVKDICRKTETELIAKSDIVKQAELYAIAYMYEHREEADHAEMMKTLTYLLFSVRKEVF